MSRRARRWQSAADSHYYQAGPDDGDIGYCFDCHEAIHAADDDAYVCIDCGGMNRRFELTEQQEQQP